MDSKKKFTYIGVSGGVIFIIIGTIIEMWGNEKAFTFKNAGEIIKSSYSLWIVAIAPIVLGAVGWIIGKILFMQCKGATERLLIQKNRAAKIYSFADELGTGNLDVTYEPEGDDDKAGEALIKLRDSLKTAKEEEEKRKEEDKKRNWTTEGLAKFADILRQRSENINDFGYEIIKNLVKYINANQGGIYIYNDENAKQEEHFLELIAAYAYERRKYTDQKIHFKDGIIGACAFEKQTIYLTDVPNEYINIKSGLGNSNPRSVILVPLKLEEKIYGVIEMASFSKLEQYQIDFLEKIAESIASTLSGVKVSIRTEQLLKQSQEQAEQMKQQEEEMRQNMEEMRATQEEAGKRQAEMEGVLNALNTSSLVVEFNPEGEIIEINDGFLTLFGMKREMMVGKHHKDFSQLATKPQEYESFWQELRMGETRKLQEHVVLPNGKEFWLSEVYSPIYDAEGNISKVMNISTDITAIKQKEKEEELRTSM